MLKKFTALFAILFMVMANATPFLERESACEESCCTTVTCCDEMKDEATQCDMEMTACEAHLFFPVVTAPLVKQEHQVQLTIEPRPEPIITPPVAQWQCPPNTHEGDSGPDLFRTLPLII
ncbi:MAG: hypothetical protein K9N34_11110 [Candidatus Marinimicrobia bacterium]|nr:hypothetical protein [Candidatus Neomarinimicrobiota bacterium]MCF7839964.1 hypothetical protein [Candidatus Neomarinimicrobiota bacterium]